MEDTKTIQQQYNELYSNYMDAQSVITNLNEIIGIADLHPKVNLHTEIKYYYLYRGYKPF